ARSASSGESPADCAPADSAHASSAQIDHAYHDNGRTEGFTPGSAMTGNEPGSRTKLSRTAHDVLVARELLDTDRPARVELVRGDADLGTHAEFAAVGELRGGVVQDDGAVDLRQEALGGTRVVRDDRIGVRRAVASNVGDGP